MTRNSDLALEDLRDGDVEHVTVTGESGETFHAQIPRIDPPKRRSGEELYDADPNCEHDIEALWSGVKCRKCPGWFCY